MRDGSQRMREKEEENGEVVGEVAGVRLAGVTEGWCLSLDQQLVCLTLVNTNCSAAIKVSSKTPKSPKTKRGSLSPALPLSLSPSHFLYSFTLTQVYFLCVCRGKPYAHFYWSSAYSLSFLNSIISAPKQ